MLCSILFSIVNKEIGKKVCFHHNKDNICSSFFILTTNLAKNGYFSENKKPLYSHFSGKLNHSHRKYSRKWFYRRIFLRCEESRCWPMPGEKRNGVPYNLLLVCHPSPRQWQTQENVHHRNDYAFPSYHEHVRPYLNANG